MDASAIGTALEHYRAQGYAVLRGVFTAEDVKVLAQGFDRHWLQGVNYRASFRHANLFYRVAMDPGVGKVVRYVQWPSYGDPPLERARRDPRLLPILEPMLGRNIKQIINQLHWKPPGAKESDFAFHQDVRFRKPRQAYRNLATSYVQTGIAIDPHTRANGAMRILPGSHLRGELAIPAPEQILGGAPDEDTLRAAGLDPAGLVDLELEPGDLALWSVVLVHGSGANSTGGDRRFYINGYVRAEDCDRGEWVFREGEPQPIALPSLVHYEQLLDRPEPHYVED